VEPNMEIRNIQCCNLGVNLCLFTPFLRRDTRANIPPSPVVGLI
jgi:hypothetical protein